MAEIGKNVIENLTIAMYENSFTVYREYIQNSADSIDKGQRLGLFDDDDPYIDIEIDAQNRKVTIYDNACGIPKDDFVTILSDIANSKKDPTQEKGFRGIGRLAGLAYCDQLVFRASYKGEKTTSVMKWDGKKLRSILADVTERPSASDLIDSIITCSTEKADPDEHFFEVVLEGIVSESNNLIDEHSVINYLEAVAPVPYENSFMYKSKIYDFAKKENLSIDEYQILVNGDPIFKPYKTRLYDSNDKQYDEVYDVEFRKFSDPRGRIIAWMWYAVTKFEKQIPSCNKMRGIRLRKENIQIGGEETLSYPRFFKEPRGNYYFMGELFAIDPDLRPNARRDYFNTSPATENFELTVKPFFYDRLYKLYHYANEVKISFRKGAEYEKKKAEYEEKRDQKGFIDEGEQKKLADELKEEKEKAEKASRKIELRKKDAEKDHTYEMVFGKIAESFEPSQEKKQQVQPQPGEKDEPGKDDKSKNKYMTQSLSKYKKSEQKLISKIYGIILNILPKDMANIVISKIQEELSK